MANTRIADVIVPEVFNPYVVQRTMELSALYQSGIISHNPELDALASSGGKTINMPYWEDLNGDDEVLSDSGALTPQKITAGQDVAVLLMRGKAWSANDLAKALSGSDPMKAIGDLTASYWTRMMQKTLINLLNGAFGAGNMTSKILDISGKTGGAEKIEGASFIDALQLMGDAKELLTATVMHSATEAQLRKNNLIETIPDSEGRPIKYFMEKRVIVDDGCPVKTGKYTTYLFGQGAIGLGNGNPPVPTETDRDSLAGDDILINRKHYILHPRGIKWRGTAAGSSPSNVELATGSNWVRVYEEKAIRIVKFVHKL
ncbi:major capsid protein [Vallitalea sp.]|jgi:hypothetical protein|uniref:major capsid protein n=1 Tax=Vallitalea sp. TaxID=1882829 RepID=UPI0025D2881A|nr:major capsid protein [Vallitalea sp.]MCT4686076.1 major capsid protein [Vallitalea sp.]